MVDLQLPLFLKNEGQLPPIPYTLLQYLYFAKTGTDIICNMQMWRKALMVQSHIVLILVVTPVLKSDHASLTMTS